MPQLARQLSTGLQLPELLIHRVAHSASHAYKTYTVAKHTGQGRRTIHHPSKELKGIQRWLARNVIESWPVHDCALAYRRGVGTAQNASRHSRNKFLLRLDLEDFFPSITSRDLRAFLENHPQGTEAWDLVDQDLFVSLVCRQGVLTIGAPTSPALSNAVCFQLDVELAGLAGQTKVGYTRYADDLYFSTNQPNVLEDVSRHVTEVLKGLPFPKNLRLNNAKTWHASTKGRRQITGIVITNQGSLSIGRQRKRWIRSQIHKWATLTVREKRALQGHIAYALSVEPDLVNRLILKYGKMAIDKVRTAVK